MSETERAVDPIEVILADMDRAIERAVERARRRLIALERQNERLERRDARVAAPGH